MSEAALENAIEQGKTKKLNKKKSDDYDKTALSTFMSPHCLRDFIEIYRNATSLWQISSKDYHNRQKRDAALQELLDFTKIYIPDATLGFVKKRIENLRSCFRRELGKVQASKTSGTGTDTVYIPKLWYFELLEFTTAQDTSTPSKYSLGKDVAEEMEPEDQELTENLTVDVTGSKIVANTPTSSQMNKRKTNENVVVKKLRIQKTIESQREKIINTAINALQQTEDDNDIVGKSIAAKLRKMKDIQKIHAEKLISDILYKGLLDQLDESTVISRCNNTGLTPSVRCGSSTTTSDSLGH